MKHAVQLHTEKLIQFPAGDLSQLNLPTRYAALWEKALDFTKAECPCADCMGEGCGQCNQTGADLDSFYATRRLISQALEIMSHAHRKTVLQVCCDLENGKDRAR